MLPVGAYLACLILLGTASARPLLLLDEAPQQGWDSRSNEAQDVGQSLSSLLSWVNGHLDSLENLLDDVNALSSSDEGLTDNSSLQRQNAFRIQNGSLVDGFLQDVMQQLDGRDARSSTGSNEQYSDTTTEVTQTPEGTHTRVYITSPGDGSGSGSVYEQISGPENPGRVPTAFDAHLEERMRQLEEKRAQGRISGAEANSLRQLFSSQVYMEAWARQQQQAEWQRNMALGQVLLQQQQWLQPMLLPTQLQEQQEEGAFVDTTAEGGPLQEVLDLMLAPFQEEPSGCRHRRQQQQKQHMMMMEAQQRLQDEQDERDGQVASEGPRVRVSFGHGSAGVDASPVEWTRNPGHARRPSHLIWHQMVALVALLAAAIISYKLVRQMVQLHRQRNELRAHLLSHEAARKVCGGGGFGGIAGAKCLDGGKGALLPPKANAYGKPDTQPERQQQQQEQQGFVSNVVYAADHL